MAGAVSPTPSPSPSLKLRLEVTEKTGVGQLMSDLQAMVNNPHLSDLCLLCKDGVKVHACRMLLMARSDVLRKMLSNGMAESRMSEISLPDITSSALLPTLEYLYTGAITHHEMELETAFLVFHAANFFHLPALEVRLKPFLCASIVSVRDCPAILAQHLSTLDSYGITHLLDDVVRSILVSLRSHCCSTCPAAFLHNLSSEAMHILFQSIKVKNKLSNKYSSCFSFMEYISIRTLLLWGASHISSEAEAFLECALPLEDSLALHFTTLKSSGKSYLEVGPERENADGELLTAEELKHVKDLQEFLSNIPWTQKELRLVWIQPVILVTVLKPLNVFHLASTSIQDVLQYQAFHNGEMNLMKWVCRPDVPYYEIQENGALLLAKMVTHDEQKPHFALTNISFTKPNGVYETLFIIEEPAQIMKILVVGARAYSRCTDTFNVGGTLKCCKSGRFELFTYHNDHNDRTESQVKWVNNPCLNKGDQIRVVVDMTKRQCLFQVSGVELVLESLFEEVGLAADCSPSGKLRVVLVSDNTLL